MNLGELSGLSPLVARRGEYLEVWRGVCAAELGDALEIEQKDFDGAFESELERLADPEVVRSSGRVDAALQATATCLARRGVPLSQLLAISACGTAAAERVLGSAIRPDTLSALSNLAALRARAYVRVYRDHGDPERARCAQPLIPLRRDGAEAGRARAGLVGRSAAIEAAREAAELSAKSRRDVLITGEDGVGKETLARLIHDLAGEDRAAFVPVNCAAVPTNLAQSELFGHSRGSAAADYPGLFRAAQGGTLFLRELTALSPEVQAQLVRVLDDRRVRPVAGSVDVAVDVRVVASTSRDIDGVLSRGELRPDLLAKFRSSTIGLAPLRERTDDIEPLVEHFLSTFCHRRCGCIWGVSQSALDVLLAAPWPGNVRELRNAIEHAVTTGEGGLIELGDLPPVLTRGVEPRAARDANASDLPSLAEAEIQLIRTTLGHFNGNKVRAAMSLGISRHKLYDRLRKLGI